MKKSDDYTNACKHLTLEKNGVFFQIGTNDGVDGFRELVHDFTPSHTFLIEPWSQLNENIRNSYDNVNYTLINCIVSDKNNEYVDLFLPDNNTSRLRHATTLPLDDWNKEKLTPVKIISRNFNDICLEHQITEIELLFIDTEGCDFKILDSINFDNICIKNIVHESWLFETEKFYTQYEEKNLLGKAGQNYIKKKLTNKNYSYNTDGRNCYYTLKK